jgi:hypothetical protein
MKTTGGKSESTIVGTVSLMIAQFSEKITDLGYYNKPIAMYLSPTSAQSLHVFSAKEGTENIPMLLFIYYSAEVNTFSFTVAGNTRDEIAFVLSVTKEKWGNKLCVHPEDLTAEKMKDYYARN